MTPPSVPPRPLPHPQPRVWTCSCRPAAAASPTTGRPSPRCCSTGPGGRGVQLRVHPTERAAPPPGGPVQPRPAPAGLRRAGPALRRPCTEALPPRLRGRCASLPARLRRHRHGLAPTSSTAALLFGPGGGTLDPLEKLRGGFQGPHGGEWLDDRVDEQDMRQEGSAWPRRRPWVQGPGWEGRGWGLSPGWHSSAHHRTAGRWRGEPVSLEACLANPVITCGRS